MRSTPLGARASRPLVMQLRAGRPRSQEDRPEWRSLSSRWSRPPSPRTRSKSVNTPHGPGMAKFARDTMKVRRVALLVSTSSAYSVGLAKFFKEAFTARGGAITAEKGYSEGDKDFKAQLTALKATNAEAIFNPGNYAE